MKWAVLLVIVGLWGCGSRKRLLEEEIRKEVKLEVDMKSRIEAQLEALELLDVDFRQVESRDSGGKVERKTQIVLHRNKESVQRTSEETEGKRQEADNSESERLEKRRRRISWGVWGAVAGCVLPVAVVAVYLWRKRKREYL